MSEPANDNAGPFSIGSDTWPGLSKLIEECGEVLQVAGKLIATGGSVDHWSGLDLDCEMEKELGDLLAAIDFVMDHNAGMLRNHVIEARRDEKAELFEEWHGRS